MQQMVRTFGQRLSEILFVKRLHIGVFMRETKGHLVVKSPQDIPARLGALLAVVNRLAAATYAAAGAGHDLNEVILHVAGGNRLHELPGVAESTDHRRADRACTGNVETRFLPALHAAHSSKGIGGLDFLLNCVDGGPDAVAVYAPAAGLMHSAARLEYQMRQEFENGASRVFASEDLLREDGYGRRTLQDDLFIGLPDDPANVGVTVYSPQLRVEQFLARKQDILRSCESLIGFKRGILSEVEAAERTATEITSSEGDYNLTIQELQAMWQNGAGQALELCAALGKVYGMPGLSFDAGKDLTMDWGDGVLFDRTRTWNEYMSMVTSGLLRPELALAWYFDLPHADAAQLAKIHKELMPQAAQAAPANNEEKKGETQIGA